MKQFYLLITTIIFSCNCFGIAPITGVTNVCVGLNTALNDATPGGTWSSSAPAIGSIDAAFGVVMGISAGTTTITYTVGTGYVTTSVTVNALPPAITVPSVILCTGSSIILTDSVPGGTWTSSDTTILSVGFTTGVVTGIWTGTQIITYTLPGGCYDFVTISAYPTPPHILGDSVLCAGSSIPIIDSLPMGYWSSSNMAIAIVGTTGIYTASITGLSPGVDTIFYSTPMSCSATRTVTVNPYIPSITGASFLLVGDTTTMHDPVTGGVWSSSFTGIATVNPSSGLVTGISPGIDTIYYSALAACGTATTKRIITVYNTLAASNTINSPVVRIFPNPSQGNLNILWHVVPSGKALLLIKDITGRDVIAQELKSQQMTIDLSSLKDGLYIISLRADNFNYFEKLMIAR